MIDILDYFVNGSRYRSREENGTFSVGDFPPWIF